MKSIIRKGAALMLFMAMVINCFSVSPIYAQEDNVNSGETMTEIENSENNMEEGFSSEDVTLPEENENNIPEKDQITHDTQIQDNEVVEDKKEVSTPVPGDASLVNYFYVGYPYLQAPASQEFVLSFGTGTENISRIVLKYQKDNGNLIELENSRQSGELYVFKKDFTESDKGTYKVIGFSYFVDSQEYTISFSDLEMDVRFGVNQEYDGFGENEGYTIDENGNEVEESNEINDSMAQAIESSVVSLDGSNVASTEDLVESVLKENVQTPQNNSRRKRSITTYSENNPLVICIDPGHGGSESGTVVVDGSLEKNMNLKIAMYLKEELEQYKNVKVVMTRTSDVYVSLQDRAKIAANAGATALVSIHINATGWGTQSSVSGAEVYYPHANYNAAVSETGKNLAQNILNELVGLGLNNLGIKVKYVYDTNTGEPAHDPAYDYPDGSVGDYYGVIRYSKELGVAGIIVEHAMSDNWNDFNNFLSSDAKLKNLGVADATGIAKAFGLSKISREEIDQMAEANKNVLAEGTYEIQSSLNTGYVLDVDASSMIDGGNVQIYQSNGSGAQGWKVTKDSKGYLTFTNVNSGKVLDVKNSQTSNNTNVWQYASNGSYAQKWIAVKSGNGYEILSALNPEFALDVNGSITANGTNVQIYTRNDSGAQKWIFSSYKTLEQKREELLEANKNVLAEGTYEIQSSLNTGYVLDVDASSMIDGGNVQIYQSNGSGAQGWKVTKDSKGYLTFTNVNSGKVLDVKNSQTSNNTNVWQYASNGSYAQKWIAVKSGNGYEILSALNPEFALDVNGSMTVNGTNVQIYARNGSGAQKWIFSSFILDTNKREELDRLATNSKNVMENGHYFIKASNINFALDLKNSNLNENALIWLYELNKTSAQRWIVSHDSIGYVSFQNECSGKYLTLDGNALVQKSLNNEYSQKWIISLNQSGGIQVISATDKSKVLTVQNDMFKNESNIIVENNKNLKGQQWVFQIIDDEDILTPIMGKPSVSVSQMVNYFKTYNKSYDVFSSYGSEYDGILKKGGAPTIESFCQIFYDEAVTEGVKPEVAFVQSMLETNFLKFGGDVLPNQYNFAGLGATGNGVKGNSFENVRIGIRAQIQHLKAYASTDSLVNECVDLRFNYVSRGSARYVEWLGINENPNHVGWASSKNYGYVLVEKIKTLLQM